MSTAPLFGRKAIVTIDRLQLDGFDCHFTIEKSLKPIPNTCKLTVFNLNENHRAQLEQLRPPPVAKVPGKKQPPPPISGIQVKIAAGYGSDLVQLWNGDLRTVNSIREHADWVTEVEAGEGEKSYCNARVSFNLPPGIGLGAAFRAIVGAMGLGEGNLAKILPGLQRLNGTKIFPHGAVFFGSAAKELSNLCASCGLEWSIQDGSVQFLQRGRALAAAIKLSEETGMLGSPTVDQNGLCTVKMLMIPDVRPGSLIVLDAERVKGNYRVEKATWSANTAAGDWQITAVCSRY